MPYRLELTRPALKQLARLPRNVRERIVAKLEALAVDPYAPNNEVKFMASRGDWRLRVGQWRAIYSLEDDRMILWVLDVGPRGSVYDA